MPSAAKRHDKLVGRNRYKIERVFGSIKRWFGGLTARYVGLVKTHGQHVPEALAYNLYKLSRGLLCPMHNTSELMYDYKGVYSDHTRPRHWKEG